MRGVTVTSRPVHVPAGPILLTITVTSVLPTTGTWAWMAAVRLVDVIHRTALAHTATWYAFKASHFLNLVHRISDGHMHGISQKEKHHSQQSLSISRVCRSVVSVTAGPVSEASSALSVRCSTGEILQCTVRVRVTNPPQTYLFPYQYWLCDFGSRMLLILAFFWFGQNVNVTVRRQ